MSTKRIKRNELDIILTDLKPTELGRVFTIKYFYDFLQKNHKKLNEIEFKLIEIKYSSQKLFASKWHAAPLRFNVDKGCNETRRVGMPNPFSMIEIFFFIRLYNNEILDYLCEKNHFSIRFHSRNSDLFYKNHNKGMIKYEDFQGENKLTVALESSGIFYKIKPFSLLKNFFASDDWFNLNNKYDYFAKLDFKECFDSIYTHTFKWIITHNTIDSKNFTNTHLYSVIDRVLQNINASISNGILVGPEFSRMMAEILLQQIDSEVHDSLILKNKQKKIDFDIRRYVDDIYIFAKDEATLDDIHKLYKDCSSNYQLKINENKTIKGRLPYIWNSWTTEVKRYTYTFKDRFIHDYNANKGYILKAKNLENSRIMASIKEEFSNIVTDNLKFSDKIVSYILKTIFNHLKRVYKRKNKKNTGEVKTKDDTLKIFGNTVTDYQINRLFDIVFYYYSFAPTFRNTQKLISLIYIIEQEIGYDKSHKILKKIVKRYDYIVLNSNLEDIIDYIHLLATYKLELTTSIEKIIWKKIYGLDNPIIEAIYLIYSQYNNKYYIQILEDVERKIKEKLSVITSSTDVLLYDELWWLYIYYNCPFLSKELQVELDRKLEFLNSDKSSPPYQASKLIYDFLKDKENERKFMEWDISRGELVSDITYKTYERTIFKNSSNISDEDYF
ncbi:MAG: RNA-directed DNA polymerase [Firmicutes bacterium]|nr:RNA-directed DNA polymerase [Bacillota bacterium]